MEEVIRSNKDLTTLFTGRHSVDLSEVDSANSYLSFILRKNRLHEGTVVRTEKQNAGRGQRGTVWESEPGKNLLLSFVFYPSFIAPKNVFLLNKTFSLGVYDFAVKWLGNDVSIKWPNDIYFGDKKLAGILIENTVTFNKIDQMIFGIGINVNQKKFPDYLINATSFVLIKDIEYNRDELFSSLCSSIESRYIQLKNGEVSTINYEYDSALFGKGKKIFFRDRFKRFPAVIQGVNESGQLIVQTENQLTLFDLKEIKFPVE